MIEKKDTSKTMKQIDEHLRRVYRDPKTDEDMPERFRDLIEKLSKPASGREPE